MSERQAEAVLVVGTCIGVAVFLVGLALVARALAW